MEMTITEGLAEIKLIEKKIEKKKALVMENLVRSNAQDDPFKKDGGGETVIKGEMQSITDLLKRHVAIREAIAKANLKTKAVVSGVHRSIAGWLVWKREIAALHMGIIQNARTKLKAQVDQYTNGHPHGFKDEKGENQILKVYPNLDYSALTKAEELIQETLDKLDGVLSLKNATTTINV